MIEVADELQSITGAEQKVISADHPLNSGLVERQNHMIKNALGRVSSKRLCNGCAWSRVSNLHIELAAIRPQNTRYFIFYATEYQFFLSIKLGDKMKKTSSQVSLNHRN